MRVRTPVIAIAASVAWLASRERNPVRWPALVRTDFRHLAADAREALVDGARAGARAEQAFDDDLAEARSRARIW